MIIIHAAQLAGQLRLWGEDAGQPSQSDRASGGRHRRRADPYPSRIWRGWTESYQQVAGKVAPPIWL